MFNKSILTAAVTTALVATLAATTGCAVTRDQETVGAYVDDTAVTTRVKAKFAADPTVSAMAISVETLKGTVQLSGFAKSAEERAMAEKAGAEAHHECADSEELRRIIGGGRHHRHEGRHAPQHAIARHSEGIRTPAQDA